MAQIDPERYLVVDARQSIEQINSTIIERVSTLSALKEKVKK
jgi:thymidylate kinase